MKLASLPKGKNWLQEEQLPVEINLGPEYQYHSIFTCPVSKEHGTEDNPPTLLKCGHVLCRQSMKKLVKSASSQRYVHMRASQEIIFMPLIST
jgi:hypothetical protein